MKPIAVIFVLSCLSLCLAKSIVKNAGDEQPTTWWGDISGVDVDFTETETIYAAAKPNTAHLYILPYPKVSNSMFFRGYNCKNNFIQFFNHLLCNRLGETKQWIGNCWSKVFWSRRSTDRCNIHRSNTSTIASSLHASITAGTRHQFNFHLLWSLHTCLKQAAKMKITKLKFNFIFPRQLTEIMNKIISQIYILFVFCFSLLDLITFIHSLICTQWIKHLFFKYILFSFREMEKKSNFLLLAGVWCLKESIESPI